MRDEESGIGVVECGMRVEESGIGVEVCGMQVEEEHLASGLFAPMLNSYLHPTIFNLQSSILNLQSTWTLLSENTI